MKFLVSDQINTEVKLQNFRKIIDKLTLILVQRQDPQILILVPKIKCDLCFMILGVYAQSLSHSYQNPWNFPSVERNKCVFCYANEDFWGAPKDEGQVPGDQPVIMRLNSPTP